MASIPGTQLAAHLNMDLDYECMGIDPGARNIGYACTGDKARLLCGVIRYGKMSDSKPIELVFYAVQEFKKIFADPRCPRNINIEDQPFTHTGISHAVSIRIHAIQAALFTLAVSMNKRVRCTAPRDWKICFGWKYMGGYKVNKQWAVDYCREYYWESWMKYLPVELRQSDHVCDAKLLAEQYKAIINYERAAPAASETPSLAPSCATTIGKRSRGDGGEQEPDSKGCRTAKGSKAASEEGPDCAALECFGGERPPELAVESFLHVPGFDVFEADS